MRLNDAWQPAKRNAAFSLLFGKYLDWLFRRSFENVWVHRNACELPRRGYVAVANHSSWWDGFVAFLLHNSESRGPFSIMMEDAQLRRFPFFRLGGAFSISKRSKRESRDAVMYAAGEARSGAAVWIFPEGEFSSNGMLVFHSGFVHVARHADVPIVPVAMRFCMLENQRPEAFVDIGTPISATSRSALGDAETSVRERLLDLDRRIASRERTAFKPLWQRRPGIDDISSRIAGWFRR